jgi:hypothetical protein
MVTRSAGGLFGDGREPGVRLTGVGQAEVGSSEIGLIEQSLTTIPE